MTYGPKMHYVPRLLLRRFRNDDNRISVYDKQKRRWFQTGVRKIGYEDDIYAQDVDSWVRDTKEDSVGKILKDMLCGDLSISSEDLSTVADFIVVQKYRVPAMRRLEDEYPGYLYDRLLETYDELSNCNDPVVLRWFKLRPHILELAKRDPSALVSQFPEFDLPNAALRGGMNSTDWRIRDAMMKMAWRLIYAEHEEYILSDDPVFAPSIDECDPEIVLPISKDCAIHIGVYGSEGMLNESVVSDEAVRQLNLRTLAGSDCFVFASQELSWVTENARKESFDYEPIVFDAPDVPGVKTPFTLNSETPESES